MYQNQSQEVVKKKKKTVSRKNISQLIILMANFGNLSSDFQTIAMDIYSSITQAADLNNNNSNFHFQTFHPSSTSLDSLFLHHHHHHQQQQLLHFQGNSPDISNNVSSTSSFLHSDHNNVDETKKRKALLQTLSSSENSGISDNANIITTETVINFETLILPFS